MSDIDKEFAKNERRNVAISLADRVIGTWNRSVTAREYTQVIEGFEKWLQGGDLPEDLPAPYKKKPPMIPASSVVLPGDAGR